MTSPDEFLEVRVDAGLDPELALEAMAQFLVAAWKDRRAKGPGCGVPAGAPGYERPAEVLATPRRA